MEQRIKTHLSHQSQLIVNINSSLEYLINFPDYLKEIENEKPKDLWFVYNVVRDNVILILTKLFHHKEKYSFSILTRLLKDAKNNDISEMNDYSKLLKEGSLLFKELDILNIRNTHVGHLDDSRVKKTINWEKVNQLKDIACKIHNEADFMIFKQRSHWDLDKDLLNFIYKKDLIYFEFIKVWRKMKRNQEKSLSIEDIDEILHLTWPK